MVKNDAIISKNEGVPWRIIEGEAILVQVETGEVIHLNEVATEIWRAVDGKKTIAEIIDQITASFEVKRDEASKDTLEFVNKLLDKSLVTLSK